MIFLIQIVEPDCPSASPKWCSITKQCESACASDFASMMYFPQDADSKISGKYSCNTVPKHFCSNEQTCQAKPLTCPASLSNMIFYI